MSEFTPVGEEGAFTMNYEGCTKYRRKISIEFTSRPLDKRHICFARTDGLLHGYVDVTTDLVSGYSVKIQGSGSADLNDLAEAEANKRLSAEVSAETLPEITALADASGIKW